MATTPSPARGVIAIAAGLLALAWLAAAPAAAQDLPKTAVLPLALAEAAARAALAACEADGHRVSVAVVDHTGLIKVQLRGDGAGPHTLDSSRKKAYTAFSLRRATSALVTLVRENPEAADLGDMNDSILILGGGLPIAAGDTVIGGIGVGGAPGGHLDEACAQAGIEAIAAQLR